MDDIRAMIQDELRQALTGLMPPPPTAAIHIAPIIPSAADAPPTTTATPPTIIVLPTAKGKPSNSIKIVPTVQIKKKNVRSAGRKNAKLGARIKKILVELQRSIKYNRQGDSRTLTSHCQKS